MEATKNSENTRAASSECLRRMDRSLADAVAGLADLRAAFEFLLREIGDSGELSAGAVPILLTVQQACQLLGFKKTKLYELMNSGLLPYVSDARNGHRRIEYQALRGLVKRLRTRRLEGKAA